MKKNGHDQPAQHGEREGPMKDWISNLLLGKLGGEVLTCRGGGQGNEKTIGRRTEIREEGSLVPSRPRQ